MKRKQRSRARALWLVILATVFTAWLGPNASKGVLLFHSARGIEVESTWASLLGLLHLAGLPLAVASPLVGILLNLPVEAFPVLVAATLIGTPALSLVGAIGAALTAGIRRGGVLVPLLVLPLYIPTLIFGVAATADPAHAAEPLMLLGAVSLVSLVLAPLASAAALRLALE